MLESSPPEAKTGMLIRRPIAEVFQAFVDPGVITKFWFTETTGPIAPEAHVTWTWGMYGVSSEVWVLAFDENRSFRIAWGEDDPSEVEWSFTDLGPERTFVEIRNRGFTGSHEEQIAAALDATGGFCWVLAGAKAWLEHGIDLQLVGDRFPPEIGHG
jgi:uncharacterized protein YndB with AHSA1/START domain